MVIDKGALGITMTTDPYFKKKTIQSDKCKHPQKHTSKSLKVPNLEAVGA